MTDTSTLCDQLAAWHRDRGDEWAADIIAAYTMARSARFEFGR